MFSKNGQVKQQFVAPLPLGVKGPHLAVRDRNAILNRRNGGPNLHQTVLTKWQCMEMKLGEFRHGPTKKQNVIIQKTFSRRFEPLTHLGWGDIDVDIRVKILTENIG